MSGAKAGDLGSMRSSGGPAPWVGRGAQGGRAWAGGRVGDQLVAEAFPCLIWEPRGPPSPAPTLQGGHRGEVQSGTRRPVACRLIPFSLSLSLRAGQQCHGPGHDQQEDWATPPLLTVRGPRTLGKLQGLPVGTGGPGHWRPDSQDAKHPLVLCCGPKRVGR